jgi:ligand-binding sensor domain-containing protein/signal transduction histidine kinase
LKKRSHWALLAGLFAIYACGGHPRPQTGDTRPDTLTSAVGQVQRGFAPPKITPINEHNLPKKVKAGKPTIKEDLTRGGTPFFINYGKEQGLSGNRVNKSMIDNQGNLWFGTAEGVSKYDGKAFTTYSSANGMPAGGVWSILQDNKGNIWFGTREGGASKYDGKTFTNYTVGQGLAGNYVLSMMQDKVGHIWFATSGGVSQFDGHTFKSYTTAQGLLSSFTQSIIQDAKGNIWVGCQEGVVEYDGKTFTDRTASLGLPHEQVQSIVQDRKGNMWFTSWGSGVAKYDGKSTTHYTTAQGLADNRIRYILEDTFGNLWFAAFSGGVSKYDGRTFLNYSTAEGLADNSVRSILEDRAGDLWFGTVGGGISKLRSRGLQYFSATRWLPDWAVESITLDQKGDIWIGSTGITKYDGRYFTTFTSHQELMDTINKYANARVVGILFDSKGHLWLASANGLFEYDDRSFTRYSTAQGLPNDYPNTTTDDSRGHIWIGIGSEGAFELDGRSITNYKIEQGLAGDTVYGIAPDGMGNLWFATNGGASKFDGKNFTTFTKAQGLPSNHVFSVLKVRTGNLWFGTDSGASVYDGKRFKTYTIADGLTGNSVAGLLEDSSRHILWFGTDRGLSGLKLDSPFHFEDFSINNGYPIYEVRANCFCLDKNGILWFGTTDNKIMKFDYSLAKNRLPPLTLFIESVRVNNESISWNNLRRKPGLNSATDSLALMNEMATTFGALLPTTRLDSMRQKYSQIRFDSVARFYPVPVNLVLPNQDNTISIDFVAIDPATTHQVAFQYMLEGHDRDWSNLSDNTTAVFGNLWEGHYTFKLRALNSNGTWAYTEYVFTVLPPWYRTWWAYALFIVVVVGIVWGLIYYRSRQLRRENRLLEEKVALRTNQLQVSIEDLKATQSQLIQSEKMASLGELTAGIAHEIQNPLNFINNFSDVNKELLVEMKDEIEKGNVSEANAIADDVIQNEDKVNQHGKRADAIVKGMLQHSRTSSGQKELTDINTLADEYLRLSYHGLRAKDKSFNATMRTDFDERVGSITIIPQDIGRVLLNLYNNAFYAVAEKGRLLPSGYEPTVAVSTKKTGDRVEIRVRDNGMGISQNLLDKIFQPFFTTKPAGSGTGLGLSLSYDIIKAHGGEIKVETEEGEFTEFMIKLPGA